MSTVYLADDLKHHRKVAIKVLRPELGSLLGPERFTREIRVAAGLSHPHIPPLYDSGAAGTPGSGEGELLWFSMPYVRGESLRHKLSRERQLPIDEAIRVARQVASALDYAHAHGLIHRDIKPENILLHEGVAMVTDFGIAFISSGEAGQRAGEKSEAEGQLDSGGRVEADWNRYDLGHSGVHESRTGRWRAEPRWPKRRVQSRLRPL